MKKIILTLLLVFIVTVSGCSSSTDNIIEKIKECGSEENIHGKGYNKLMRECFLESYKTCSQAKVNSKKITIEGDPIITTAIIKEFLIKNVGFILI